MKLLAFLLSISASLLVSARDPYKTYLLSKKFHYQRHFIMPDSKAKEANSSCLIPRHEIPKGSVFCRLEDKLTRATKVWIRVGMK